MRRLAAISALLVLAAGFAAAAPSISFDGKQVIAKGVTPGGDVACYGVAHDFQAVYPELLRWAKEVTDTDGDGTVTFEIPREVPHDSQWFVVDLATGLLATATPRGDEQREVAFAGAGVIDAKNAPRGVLRVDRSIVDLFVARYGDGGGTWVLLAGDGAGGDADGQSDGAISAELKAFRPVGRSAAAPAAFAQADLIIAIDPFTLEYSILGRKGR